MDQKLKLTIRTANHDRQAVIHAPDDVTVEEILNDAKQQWNLSDNYEYVLRCERLGSQLEYRKTLREAGVVENDVLEIQPLADAGQ